jgi:hypothetical protein
MTSQNTVDFGNLDFIDDSVELMGNVKTNLNLLSIELPYLKQRPIFRLAYAQISEVLRRIETGEDTYKKNEKIQLFIGSAKQ